MPRATLAAVLVLTIVGAVSADEPISGWDRARWGMSSSDIQTAYPDAKPDERKEYDVDGRKYYSALALPGISVGGYDFTVHFLVDNSDKLAAVRLFKDFDKDISGGELAFDRVKELLIQKYGRPTTEKRSEPNAAVRSFRSVWRGSSAQITFQYASTPLDPPACFIILTYAKPGETDKL